MHHTAEFLGMTFNVDTIWGTSIAGTIVLGLGSGRRAQRDVGRAGQAAADLGEHRQLDHPAGPGQHRPAATARVIQLAIMLFTLILISNWLELIPTQALVSRLRRRT